MSVLPIEKLNTIQNAFDNQSLSKKEDMDQSKRSKSANMLPTDNMPYSYDALIEEPDMFVTTLGGDIPIKYKILNFKKRIEDHFCLCVFSDIRKGSRPVFKRIST